MNENKINNQTKKEVKQKVKQETENKFKKFITDDKSTLDYFYQLVSSLWQLQQQAKLLKTSVKMCANSKYQLGEKTLNEKFQSICDLYNKSVHKLNKLTEQFVDIFPLIEINETTHYYLHVIQNILYPNNNDLSDDKFAKSIHAQQVSQFIKRNLDPYEILKVDKKANELTIREAYKELVKKEHPDKKYNSEESKRRFQDIHDAYEILVKPELFEHYSKLTQDPGRRKKTKHLIFQFVERGLYPAQIFNINPSQSLNEIRTDYLKLAQKYHTNSIDNINLNIQDLRTAYKIIIHKKLSQYYSELCKQAAKKHIQQFIERNLDPEEILNVDFSEASINEIKQARHVLLLNQPPEQNSEQVIQRFLDIQVAYEILTDNIFAEEFFKQKREIKKEEIDIQNAQFSK